MHSAASRQLPKPRLRTSSRLRPAEAVGGHTPHRLHKLRNSRYVADFSLRSTPTNFGTRAQVSRAQRAEHLLDRSRATCGCDDGRTSSAAKATATASTNSCVIGA